MTETGPASYECPRHPGRLHVIEESFLPEVVDPASGLPVADGETGELVLTTLTRTASPLLRYRTGDLVRASRKSCPCGSAELSLEGGILGRVDDMVVVRGVNLYPAALEAVMRSCPSAGEYRAELREHRGMLEIEIRTEPSPECENPDALAGTLEAILRKAFHLRIPVHLAPPGSLPRFEMKSRRWVRIAG